MAQAHQERRKLGRGTIAALVGMAVLLIFIFQNTENVKFNFLFVTFSWSLWLYTIVVAAFGALAWVGVSAVRRHRRRQRPLA